MNNDLCDRLREERLQLQGWQNAYPLSAFPEPDLDLAAKALKDAGLTLDGVSASNMRHVVNCIVPDADAALSHGITLIEQQQARIEKREAECQKLIRAADEAMDGWNACIKRAETAEARIKELEEALEKIDQWCCPVLCRNCADNQETARSTLNSKGQDI